MLKENYFKVVYFEKPDFIPMNFVINAACWHHYPQNELFDLMEEHKFLFPNFIRPKGEFIPHYSPVARKNEPFTDDFGCVWTTADDGITGTVVKHPIKTWEDLEFYQAPDPKVSMGLGAIDWNVEKEKYKRQNAAGQLTSGSLRHGHTFLQLCDLRGYENVILDMADEVKGLWTLIEILENFNAFIINKFVEFGTTQIGFPEDLGMQYGPMLSPIDFKKYIKPSYQRLMKPAIESGAIIHMHSDGDIKTLADDLIDSGVNIINLQDLVNGIDWIAERYAGKICIDLDIDRQQITPYGTPSQIDDLILEEVKKLSTPHGGLMMTYGLYPNVPLENIKALMDAMEKYAFYYN